MLFGMNNLALALDSEMKTPASPKSQEVDLEDV